MKQLIRSLYMVSDCSHYFHRGSDSPPRRPARNGRSVSKMMKVLSGRVPEGHVPVYVGEEMKRFVVRAEVLNHPVFVELLNESANEYGYKQQGVLRIPCGVPVFERALQMLKDEGSKH